MSGIDAKSIRGSGPGGRIVEADLVQASASTTSQMRRAIARRTSESAATIPHFTLRAEADIHELMRRRETMPKAERPSLGDCILWAQMSALQAHPRANRIWKDDQLASVPQIAVGLVVALDDGILIAPIPSARTLSDLSKQRVKIVGDARGGNVSTLSCASSLSNLGASRVDEFQAIIPLGQSSILAVGRAALRPIAVGDALAVRTTLRLTLSVDHRVLDGQPAADFLGAIVNLLENPDDLLADAS